MERDELAPRHNVSQQLVKWIGLDDVRVVPHGRAGDAIAVRQLVIEFSSEVIFRCDLLPGKAENPGIPIPEEGFHLVMDKTPGEIARVPDLPARIPSKAHPSALQPKVQYSPA